MNPKIAVLICYRDRPTEISLLLQSILNQTKGQFRIYISDDNSGTPIESYHFLVCLVNHLKEKGINLIYNKNPFQLGVSKNRQKNVEMALQDNWADLFLRLDDDVIIENNYIEKLLEVINKGYDLASGVTPFIGQPQFKRESKFLKGVVNRVILDKEGNFIFNGDDCGHRYLDETILPAHHFRSCALYKKEIHNKVNYTPTKLTKHGFREEEIFSFKCLSEGFKIGVNTKAIAWHMLTPSGGERWQNAQEDVKLNEEILKQFTKDLFKKGNFIEEYNKKLNIKELNSQELLKETNLKWN